MSEKIPGLRIVGGATEEHKEKAKRRTEALLYEDHLNSLSKEDRDKLAKVEIKRSPAVLEAIDFANERSNRLREDAGVDRYDIPAANYHILPSKEYEKAFGNTTSGKTIYGRQGSVYNIGFFKDNPIEFALTILHETLHLKGHLALEVEEDSGGHVKSLYRTGLSAYSSQMTNNKGREHIHLRGLHEAVVSELEKKSIADILHLESLEKEVRRMSEEPAQSLVKKISREKGIPIDDIIWVGKDEKQFSALLYPIHRRVLKFVCDKIYEKYRLENEGYNMNYSSSDEVFEEFSKAQFNGNLLPIGRLVERTFGKHGFRTLSNMGLDDESAELCLEALERMYTGN